MRNESPAGSDEALMLAYAQQGDTIAFETLYNRHEKAVWRFVLRSVQVRSLADDLMQDVWFSVARHAGAYRPGQGGARFGTWLFTLARNRVIDHFRTAKNHLSLDSPTDDDNLHEHLASDSGFGPVQQLASRQQGRAMIAALEQLPVEQREAFLLLAEAGMSVEEIAGVVGVSFETVKSRLRYARSKLRAILAEFAEAAP